jgi:hypothetical protein
MGHAYMFYFTLPFSPSAFTVRLQTSCMAVQMDKWSQDSGVAAAPVCNAGFVPPVK